MISEDNSSNSQPRSVAKLGLEILKWIILGVVILWIAKKVPQRDWDILIHQPKSWSYLALALAASTLPLTPGGLGMQELWIDALFRQIPTVSPDYSGLVMSTMFRAILVLVAAIGGVIYLTSGRRNS